jgi:hypothetical protein
MITGHGRVTRISQIRRMPLCKICIFYVSYSIAYIGTYILFTHFAQAARSNIRRSGSTGYHQAVLLKAPVWVFVFCVPGMTIRQIERLMRISRGIVQRA